jgi:alpha-tubulin suppressor-like RCC1 family protein
MLITDIAHKSIQFIACGDNYSAAVSQFGEVFVTGNVEGGKLGLGKAYTSGLLLNFMIIPDLPPIKSVACGPSHMLALSEF